MRLAVISEPTMLDGEAEVMSEMLAAGLPLLHLRKPGCTESQMVSLIEALPSSYRDRMVLHDWHRLAVTYGIGGIHLNSRNNHRLFGYSGRYSCSCHSLQEVALRKGDFDYVFLSPIFDSISKEGYGSHFTAGTLHKASLEGLIDRRVMALGGVRLGNLPLLAKFGFGGAAMLGSVWGCFKSCGNRGAVAYLNRCIEVASTS